MTQAERAHDWAETPLRFPDFRLLDDAQTAEWLDDYLKEQADSLPQPVLDAIAYYRLDLLDRVWSRLR